MRPLFELAENSATQLDGYLDAGRVLVARRDGALVGHLQLVPTGRAGEVELKNMAVVPAMRRTGVGSALVATGFERDAFTPETGYPEPVVIDGIPLRDRVWLSQGL